MTTEPLSASSEVTAQRQASGRLVIRPSYEYATRRERRNRERVTLLLLGFAVSGLALSLRSGIWWFGAGVAGAAVVLVGSIFLYFRNAALFADENVVGRVTPLGRVRTVNRSVLARIVLKRVNYAFAPKPGRPEMYFLDRAGKVLMVVMGAGWRPEELAKLWQRLSITPEGSFEDVVSLHQVHAHIPVGWMRRYAGLVAFFVMFAIVLGVSILLGHFGIHIRR